MPIASRCWKWSEPRLRTGSIGVRAVIVTLLAVGGFFYVLLGPLVFDAAYWLLGKIVRVQADRRVRIGASLVLAVVYLASMEYIGLNEKPSTQPGATSTTAIAAATSPAATAASATPTLVASSLPSVLTTTAMATPSATYVIPSPSATMFFTAAQVTECQNAEDILDPTVWDGQEIANHLPGSDVGTDRPEVLGWIDRFLNAAQFEPTPTAASLQWQALIAAMKTAEPLFAAPMTPAQYKAALDTLSNAIDAFDKPCQGAIKWGQDNLPQ